MAFDQDSWNDGMIVGAMAGITAYGVSETGSGTQVDGILILAPLYFQSFTEIEVSVLTLV